MHSISKPVIFEFLERIGQKLPQEVSLFLLGGSALCIIGNPRVTNDIDYTLESTTPNENSMDTIIQHVAKQMDLDVESVPLGEFIPLPAESSSRRKYVGRYGNLEVYIFDLYSIAISKIARGFDSDIEDVLFLLKKNLIDFSQLQKFIVEISPKLLQSDIDPKEFDTYFNELQKLWLEN
jgi:hypothetical protein